MLSYGVQKNETEEEVMNIGGGCPCRGMLAKPHARSLTKRTKTESYSASRIEIMGLAHSRPF